MNTYFIGLNDKDTKKQEISTTNAMNIIKRLMLRQGIYGYTMLNDDKIKSNIKGGYRHEDGYFVEENSIIILLFFVENIQISNLISDTKIALNQESITDVVLNAEVKFR